MGAETCFATAFYHVSGYAPNLGVWGNASKDFAYYRCMVVMFYSVRLFYPEARLIIFSNREIGGKYREDLKKLRVETVIVPQEAQRYVIDPAISNTFPGCLFTLDVINFLAVGEFGAEISSLILLDSDCIFLDRVDELINRMKKDGAISALPLGYALGRNMNGQSRATLSLLRADMIRGAEGFQEEGNLIETYGGEFLAVPPGASAHLAREIERYWTFVKQKTDVYGTQYTEEHILSLVLNDWATRLWISPYVIKRAWTSDVYQNIDGTELNYAILHMPAEKAFLFKSLYRLLEKNPDLLTSISLRDIIARRLRAVSSPTVFSRYLRYMRNAIRRLRAAKNALPGIE